MCSPVQARCYLSDPRHRQGSGEHMFLHPTLPPASMRAPPAKAGKRIKKQYLCQRKTFAERLNPHLWCRAAAPYAVIGWIRPPPTLCHLSKASLGRWKGPGLASPRNPQNPLKEGPKEWHADLGTGHGGPLGLGNSSQSSGWKTEVQTLHDPSLGC